jgi:hypothetical protein
MMQQIAVALVKGRTSFSQQHQGSDPFYGSSVHGEVVPAGSARKSEEDATCGEECMHMIIVVGWWNPGQPLALTSR